MSRTLRPVDIYAITTRNLEVLRVADVTPGMRRVTLGGEQLKAHTAPNGMPVDAFRSDGFDDEFKIILKHPDAAETVVPEQGEGHLHWPRADEHLVMRTYTVRRWDPEAGEIDVDFVVHGVGLATTWARRVQPGERVQIAGPKSSAGHPEGVDWTLVVGDETALPAIGRWLEEWPDGARGQVFVEIERDEHRQDLRVPDGVELTWLSRDGAEPGTTTLLFDAVRAADWWEGTPFAWVAGESITLTPIRRWLRNEKGLDRTQIDVTGYWRRQEVAVSAEDASLPDLDGEDDDERFGELTEFFGAFAVRTAATIGLGDALADGPRTTAQLAEATGTDPAGLGRLLRYLAAVGVLEADADAQGGERVWGLAPLGRDLEDDEVAEELSFEGYEGHQHLAGALALLAAVRTGRGDHERWFGAGYADDLAAHPEREAQRRAGEAVFAGYVAGAIAKAAPFDGRSSVVVAGAGAPTVAEAIAREHTGATVRVVGPPSALAGLSGDRVVAEPGSLLEARPTPADVVLLLQALAELPDSDAEHVLARAAASLTDGGRLVVMEDDLDEEEDHDCEHDLIHFALTGGGGRTEAELADLFARAGLVEADRVVVGWGDVLRVLAPR